MKPFDLKKALAGAPVQTTDGRRVSEIHFFRTAMALRQVIAVIEGHTKEYDIDGMLSNAISTEFMAGALVMTPNKKEGWVNLYRVLKFDGTPGESVYVRHSEVFPSAEWAEKSHQLDLANRHCSAQQKNPSIDRSVNIACVRIEWEE